MKCVLWVALLFFLMGCSSDKSDFKKAVPGTAGSLSLFSASISKTCQEGSVKVSKKSSSLNRNASASKTFDEGDAVVIEGTMRSSGLGSCPGSLRFKCDGSTVVGGNRVFVCNGGSVSVTPTFSSLGIGSPSSLSPRTPSSSSPYSPSPYAPKPTSASPLSTVNSIQMIDGQVHFYQNGTAAAAWIRFSNPKVSQFYCSASFTCL